MRIDEKTLSHFIRDLVRLRDFIKDEFFRECRKLEVRIFPGDWGLAIGLTTGKVRRKWQLMLAIREEGKRRTRTVGLVDTETDARRLLLLYRAAKHLDRTIEVLSELQLYC